MPQIQRAEILTVDILQVGSSTAGSTAHLQVVGLILPAPVRDQGSTSIPRTNVRPEMDRLRANHKLGYAEFSKSLTRVNDIMDILRERNDELFERVRKLEREPVVARYNANITTPSPLAVASDVVPWAQVTVEPGESWFPIAAWATAKTAPVGDDLIFDVLRSNDAETTVNSPVWESIFQSGDANKLVLPDGSNRLLSPITKFA